MSIVDLVIQAPGLAGDAVQAFEVALQAPRALRRGGAARLGGLEDGTETRRIGTALAAYWKCDAAFVPADQRTTAIRVLAMDMDSTVITIECIDELARLAGKGEEVAAITEAAMQGRIANYAQSLRQRVALLAGAPATLAERVIAERLRYSPGARELLAEARALGWRTLLVSGGFTSFTEHVQRELGFDETCSNRLVVEDGCFTGEVLGPERNGGAIVDARGKADALAETCRRLRCAPEAAIAVGDGANDLEMMALAGVSVAYHAKPAVRARAKYSLDAAPLDGVLALFADQW